MNFPITARMKTKTHFLVAAVALLLAIALVRHVSRWDTPAEAAREGAAATPAVSPHGTVRGAEVLRAKLPKALREATPPVRRREPGTSVAELMRQPGWFDSQQRQELIQRFVASHDVAELEDMLMDKALGEAKPVQALPEDVSEAILRRLAREDAPWTGDFLLIMPDSSLRGELLGTVMAEWGGNDLTAALEWAQNLTDASLKGTSLVHLSYRWYVADPEAALTYAALQPKENRQLLTTLLGQWSRDQPEAAAAWVAETFRDPELSGIGASAVATWATKDDLAAAEFVLSLPGGKHRDEASISVMSALARTDPATGALWADAFPAGPNRDYAIENLVYNWATLDPASALAWSNRLTAAERDVALFAGTGGLIETKPEVAATWVTAIQDETRRIQQSERVAQRWLQVDRWSAEFWIRQSTLPEERKRRLLGSGG